MCVCGGGGGTSVLSHTVPLSLMFIPSHMYVTCRNLDVTYFSI